MSNKKLENNKKVLGKFYVLGDSLCDTGALVGGGSALFKHLKIPRVIKMKPPFYNNSFSNGKIAVQIIADYFDFSLQPAWKFDLFALHDERIGNNYAVGGALATKTQSLTINALLMNSFTLNKQVTALVSQHQLHFHDIIFISFGGNDILNASKKTTLTEQNEIINNAVMAIEVALRALITAGAHTIILVNCADLSVVPLFKNSTASKKDRIQTLCQNFNDKLLTITKIVDTKNKIIINFDLFHCMQLALATFQNKDSTHNITDAATNTDLREVIICGNIVPHFNAGTTMTNINKYFFFDDIHPTHWAHNFIAQEIIKLMKENIKI